MVVDSPCTEGTRERREKETVAWLFLVHYKDKVCDSLGKTNDGSSEVLLRPDVGPSRYHKNSGESGHDISESQLK